MASFPPSIERTVRRGVGALFVLTGAFKMLAWPRFFAFCHDLAPQVLAGTAAEAPTHAALFATALIVPPLEIVGGAALWRGQRVRLFSALLALDMLGAIITVGIPGRLGKSHEVSGAKIGTEPWRLPLEMILLLLCVWFLVRREETPST
jgi:uncharacterized membrane protein YphA (DoxX/SURF4 family)